MNEREIVKAGSFELPVTVEISEEALMFGIAAIAAGTIILGCYAISRDYDLALRAGKFSLELLKAA